MIIQTGMRTDIPAFYSRWFLNRLKEGFVLVRNPYHPQSVTRYRLSPDVVDLIAFCTKDPSPLLPHMDALSPYGQYWFVTITPYGRDVEPRVPDKKQVLEDFKRLSSLVGTDCVGWRYDPILLSSRYTMEYHLSAFEQIAKTLSGYTGTCVISFIDIYRKVAKNFPEAAPVPEPDRIALGKELIRIAGNYGMTLRPCAEGDLLAPYGADCSGCMTVGTFEKALGSSLLVPHRKTNQRGTECACLLGSDIGAYDTCGHLCRYCYANTDAALVKENMRRHDPNSPFLLGGSRPDDIIHDADQKCWLDPQLRLPF